jgi:hypothetical protein
MRILVAATFKALWDEHHDRVELFVDRRPGHQANRGTVAAWNDFTLGTSGSAARVKTLWGFGVLKLVHQGARPSVPGP